MIDLSGLDETGLRLQLLVGLPPAVRRDRNEPTLWDVACEEFDLFTRGDSAAYAGVLANWESLKRSAAPACVSELAQAMSMRLGVRAAVLGPLVVCLLLAALDRSREFSAARYTRR